MDKKKIYFAGSIRGGRSDMGIYRDIINYLKRYATVCTEHIGLNNLHSDGEKIDNNYIYHRDCKWLKECDMVVAEVTNPSIGVGYEIGYAAALNKPIICFYRSIGDKKLSALISGNPHLKVYSYNAIDDIYNIIDNLF